MKRERIGAFLAATAFAIFATSAAMDDAKAGDPARSYGSSMTGTVATPTPVPPGPEDTTVTVNFTITLGAITEGGVFHDIHLKPPKGKTLPPVMAPGSGTGQIAIDDQSTADDDQEWDYKANGSGVHIYTDKTAGEGYVNPGGQAPQTLSFALTFQGKPDELDGVSNIEWKLTSNGKKGYKGDDVLDGWGDDDGLQNPGDANDPCVGGVVANLGINGGDPVFAYIGTVVPLGVQVGRTFEGKSYQVYTSTTLDADFDDAREIGINDTVDLLPPAWGMTVQNGSGLVGTGGEITLPPTFTLPNDTSLVGNSFYAVIAIIDNGDIIASSYPVEVTITQ